jgi:hypothetical protein
MNTTDLQDYKDNKTDASKKEVLARIEELIDSDVDFALFVFDDIKTSMITSSITPPDLFWKIDGLKMDLFSAEMMPVDDAN